LSTNDNNAYNFERVEDWRKMSPEYTEKTMVAILNGDVTSYLERAIAAKID
jgi:hypothetical protein